MDHWNIRTLSMGLCLFCSLLYPNKLPTIQYLLNAWKKIKPNIPRIINSSEKKNTQGCLHVLAIVIILLSFPLGKHPEMELLNLMVDLFLIFKESPYFLHSGWTNSHSHHLYKGPLVIRASLTSTSCPLHDSHSVINVFKFVFH